MEQYFTSYSPKHRVIIKDLKTGAAKNIGTKGDGDISNDLVSLSTSKAYGRAAGTWQLMLTYRVIQDGKRYHELIQSDDIITIELNAGDGSGFKPVMMGLVDRVSRVRHIDTDGSPTRQVKISGQDMGKLLMVHDIGWDIKKENLSLTKQQQGDETPPPKEMKSVSRQFREDLQTGIPGRMITNLFGYTFQRPLPDVAKYFYRRYDTDDNWKLNMPNMRNLRGVKLWEAMKRAEHAPYNILTTDTDTKDPGKFWIILEKQPIKETGKLNRAGDKLHKIDETDIISDDLGISDIERINFLYYSPAPTSYYSDLGVDVLMVSPDLTQHDPDSLPLHGYCLKTITDDFVPPSITNLNDKTDASLGDYAKRTKLFWNWYKNNHTYESGTIHIHLKPDIRAGNGLMIRQGNTDKYKEYLIEQVAHQYVVWPQPHFVTTLHVTRGQDAPPAQTNSPNSAEATQVKETSYV